MITDDLTQTLNAFCPKIGFDVKPDEPVNPHKGETLGAEWDNLLARCFLARKLIKLIYATDGYDAQLLLYLLSQAYPLGASVHYREYGLRMLGVDLPDIVDGHFLHNGTPALAMYCSMFDDRRGGFYLNRDLGEYGFPKITSLPRLDANKLRSPLVVGDKVLMQVWGEVLSANKSGARVVLQSKGEGTELQLPRREAEAAKKQADLYWVQNQISEEAKADADKRNQ